ncbi:efflux transporter outer membrane subunit [Rhodoblastus sp. 17X3]|uniref:efflux transporter outer membrane subunit n=1 Tax=Rhodoblastus sp. 17X3 TaxID=3047026 RepID=UPI0024B70A75|nr:efflux transporter outer membrane subunit [Rhodoblastus sp. 17X3]MDI9848947.1 efflux transporter outer membrane subunit [Rhodoblastus sp. 17X3]
MSRRLLSGVGLCLALAALSGCELAPPYAPPPIAAPEQFKTSPPAGPRAGVAENWWRSFRSPELDRLQARIELDNPDYAVALARYQRAKAVLDLASSSFYPAVVGQPQLSYNKQSQNRPLRSANQPTYYGANQLFGQLSWEIDLWGRVRDLVAATKAGAQANDDLLAATRLSLHASLARAYIALRGADAQAALLARTIKLYQSALDLTQERLKQNIAPPIDVERARVQLANAQAASAEIARGRAVLENALAALSGEMPSSFRIAPAAVQPSAPRPPRAAPASLLLRRPDVAARERLLFAANERIGAAKADFLPRFYILLSGGTQSTNLNLLNFHNSLWSYGPGVSAPIFDGGQRQAALDVARAEFSAAAAEYKGSVLAAYQEVEDALASIRWLSAENASLAVAAGSAQRALDMSMSLYKDGAASSLDVVTAQSAALDADRAKLAVETRLLEQYVELMLALGGGWSGQAPPPEPQSPPPIALLGPQGHDPDIAAPAAETQK